MNDIGEQTPEFGNAVARFSDFMIRHYAAVFYGLQEGQLVMRRRMAETNYARSVQENLSKFDRYPIVTIVATSQEKV